MPTLKRPRRRQWSEGIEVCDVPLEMSLVFGRGSSGTSRELRTLDDWQRHWARWRDAIMPKSLEHRPGTRPFAMYAVGEIPARPVLQSPPMDQDWFRLYVPGDADGTWHCDYPPPFMQREAYYLRDLGIVSADEFRRWRAWMRAGGGCTYPVEVGLFE